MSVCNELTVSALGALVSWIVRTYLASGTSRTSPSLTNLAGFSQAPCFQKIYHSVRIRIVDTYIYIYVRVTYLINHISR